MTKIASSALALLLLATLCIPQQAIADELSDAIRQTEQAKEGAKQASRNADSERSKAWQLYKQTLIVKLQISSEHYGAASSRFEQAADAFNSARASLVYFQDSHNQAHLSDAERSFRQAGERYNEGVEEIRQATEFYNGGIDEYNWQLRTERKKKATDSREDAFDLMKKIEELAKRVGEKPSAASKKDCLKQAYWRAQTAFTKFNMAAGDVDRPDSYSEDFKAGIQYYNEAVEIVKQVSEKGTCRA
jgi:hypothetical protein